MKAGMNTSLPLQVSVEQFIREKELFLNIDRVLVACSGGPDSTACLHILFQLSSKFKISIECAHLNYCLRGDESDGDEAFVRDLARQLGIKCHVKVVDAKQYSQKRKITIQEGARELRYLFFDQVLGKEGKVAVAHNAEDNVETILMNMVRGAGVTGFAGMKSIRGNVIRPLLATGRLEILEYLKKNDIIYRVDSSNSSLKYTRNSVRHRLLPLLEEYNPKIVETINRSAGILAKENAFVQSFAVAAWDSVLIYEGEGRVVLDLAGINKLDDAVMMRVLRSAILEVKGNLSGISNVHLDDIVKTFDSLGVREKIVHLPDKVKVVKKGSDLVFFKSEQHRISVDESFESPSFQLSPDGGEFSYFNMRLDVKVLDALDDGECDVQGKESIVLSYEKLKFPLTVRNWRKGDLFYPAGMGGKRKKLQDLFVDIKLPGQKRKNVPILCSGDDIVWIVGIRADERFKVDINRGKMLLVTKR